MLEDLRTLEDVLVRDEQIEQPFPPLLTGVKSLADQFLDNGFDRGDLDRLAEGIQHSLQSVHPVASGRSWTIAILRPFPADIGLPDQRNLAGVHAEETGGEAPGRFLVVLVLLGGIGQGGRSADAGDLVRLFPGQRPHTPDQAGDLGSRGPGVSVGLVKDEVLDRGLGKERHVRRAGGQHF